MLSWKTTIDFDAQHHLFTNKIKTNYKIDIFICSCNETSFIIRNPYQHIEYSCKKCENNQFYDANLAYNNFETFILQDYNIELELIKNNSITTLSNQTCNSCGYTFFTPYYKEIADYKCEECKEADWDWREQEYVKFSNLTSSKKENIPISLKCHYETVVENKKVIVRYYTMIPTISTKYDFLVQKVTYEKKPLYSLSISKDVGLKVDKNISLEEDIDSQMANDMFNFFKQNHNNLDIKYIDRCTRLSEINFFAQNSHLHSYEFVKWEDISMLSQYDKIELNQAFLLISNNKQQKSIKKALFQNYQRQIKEHQFHHALISIFTNFCDDTNIIVRYLELNIYHINIYQHNIKNIISLVDWLKSRYSKIQIFHFFKGLEKKNRIHIFFDMLRMFVVHLNHDTLDAGYANTKCNIVSLHDALSDIINNNLYVNDTVKYRFKYHKRHLDMSQNVEDYHIKLPYDNFELNHWANILHNCLSMYNHSIATHESIIFGFFVEDMLYFAVELDGQNIIIQASGKYNKRLNEIQQKAFNIWYAVYVNKS